MTPPSVFIATNNGAIGGGEIMLIALAEAFRELGAEVAVVGPRHPRDLLDQAASRGFCTVRLDASSRSAYMRALRRWRRRNPAAVLWCNGLVPAAATAGMRRRVVHLHQLPTGLVQRLLARTARLGSAAAVVPSAYLTAAVRGALVLPNWTADIQAPRPAPSAALRIGFIGRLTPEKGVSVLAEAVGQMAAAGTVVELVVAGEARFTDGASRAVVEASLSALGDRVTRLGWAAPAEVLARIDVLACPSVAPESFGLVAAEAMAARVPVVVTDAGALPEVVGPSHPWVARADDAGDLARVLGAAAAALPARAGIDAARARWESEFSPDAGRRHLAALCERIDELRGNQEDVRA